MKTRALLFPAAFWLLGIVPHTAYAQGSGPGAVFTLDSSGAVTVTLDGQPVPVEATGHTFPATTTGEMSLFVGGTDLDSGRFFGGSMVPGTPGTYGVQWVGEGVPFLFAPGDRLTITGEGGVFRVTLGDPVVRHPGDFNRDGSVSEEDVFNYLAAWFGNDPAADVNGSGDVTTGDIFDFLENYFGG